MVGSTLSSTGVDNAKRDVADSGSIEDGDAEDIGRRLAVALLVALVLVLLLLLPRRFLGDSFRALIWH
jgi:hypothetical protein